MHASAHQICALSDGEVCRISRRTHGLASSNHFYPVYCELVSEWQHAWDVHVHGTKLQRTMISSLWRCKLAAFFQQAKTLGLSLAWSHILDAVDPDPLESCKSGRTLVTFASYRCFHVLFTGFERARPLRMRRSCQGSVLLLRVLWLQVPSPQDGHGFSSWLWGGGYGELGIGHLPYCSYPLRWEDLLCFIQATRMLCSLPRVGSPMVRKHENKPNNDLILVYALRDSSYNSICKLLTLVFTHVVLLTRDCLVGRASVCCPKCHEFEFWCTM